MLINYNVRQRRYCNFNFANDEIFSCNCCCVITGAMAVSENTATRKILYYKQNFNNVTKMGTEVLCLVDSLNYC